jgi:hypothetical protein
LTPTSHFCALFQLQALKGAADKVGQKITLRYQVRNLVPPPRAVHPGAVKYAPAQLCAPHSLFLDADLCTTAQQRCTVCITVLLACVQEGYDHSYYFISSFIEDHVAFHAQRLHKA